MKLSDRRPRVPTTTQQAGQAPVPHPVSAAEAPAPAEAASIAAPVPPRRRGMTEERARRIARDQNAKRKAGEPIWTAWRLQQPDGREWDVGTVTINLPDPDAGSRSFDDNEENQK